MDCPVCKKPMVVLEFKGVELDFCLDCQGCWLDHGELGLISGTAGDELTIENPARGTRRCPRCHQRMTAGRLPNTPVTVDVCSDHRHGMWLDRGELQAVVESRAGAGASSALAGFCADVFGKQDNVQTKQNT